MSSHKGQPKTPSPDPERLQAHRESQQSTNPNKGSSASGQLLEKVRKDDVEPSIAVDMEKRKYCNPEDMVLFLLALCCQDDSSTAAVSRDEIISRRFKDCLREVNQIANSPDLWKQLENYKSARNDERKMYQPFTEALNYALEDLSRIDVDGLPEFKAHIVFAVCDKGVVSNRSLHGSRFKPDIAVLSIEDACEFYGLGELQANEPQISQFVNGAKEKSQSGTLRWNSIRSAVEVKRKSKRSWATLKKSGLQEEQFSVIPGANNLLDEEPDDSQPTTPVSSTTLVSSKRSASAAGMDVGAETSGSKRQRTQKDSVRKTTLSLAIQDDTYAAEKFSDSFSISHVLNLLIDNDCLWISWIDREGAIFSSGFSFFGNLPLMLVLLLTLQRFGRRQWGYISELTTEDHSVSLHPVNPDGTLGKDEVDIDFDPNDKVHSSWALLGRATTVVGAKRHDDETAGEEHTDTVADTKVKDHEGDVVGTAEVQASGGTSSLESGVSANSEADGELRKEWDTFCKSRDEYREAFAKAIKSRDLVLKVSWPETSRVEEWRIIKHAHTLGEEDKFIKGHIPEVRYARDLGRYSTRHIRSFLGLEDNGSPGTRTLRLVVMNRLRPIFDLDGEGFWNVFWQCVACHYRLWLKGICHGDISLGNLMCDFPTGTGDPVGILNDFDLATWVEHHTTNNDRTGTIPFMALDMLKGGLDGRIPRLYRHDLESFSWVLAYVTVAYIEYENHTIKDSPAGAVEKWFKDKDDREAHIMSKFHFHEHYDEDQYVNGRYYDYSVVIKKILQYWHDFHKALDSRKHRGRPRRPYTNVIREEPALSEPEADNPADSLESFIKTVEGLLEEKGVTEEFAVVKNLLEAV